MHNMNQTIVSATAASAVVAFGRKLPVIGDKPIVKVGIGAGAFLLTRKMEGVAGAAIKGAAIGLAIDGMLDFVPGMRA